MLKEAVVGGPSLVFIRNHEAGKPVTRPHMRQGVTIRCQRPLSKHHGEAYAMWARKGGAF